MAQYLDKAGLQVLWTKIKDHDTSTLNAAKNDATSKDTALKNELTGVINGVNADVTTLKGYFTNGVANKAIADKNGADIAATYIPLTQKGVANGIATLGSDGKVLSSQLPAYVDDVVEYDSQASFPTPGESGIIYVDMQKNKTFRWSGSTYVEISASLALGETSSSAYAGDKGKATTDALNELLDSIVQEVNDTTSQDAIAKWGAILNYLIDNYQETLVSGTNIATVNGQSLLNGGNISIEVDNLDMSGYYTTTQSDAKFVALTGNQNIDGYKTFLKGISVTDTPSDYTGSVSGTTYYNGAIMAADVDGEYLITIPSKSGEIVVKNNNLIEMPSGGIIYKDGINADEYAGFVVSPTGVPVVISKDLELCFTRTNDYVMYTNVYTFPDKNGTVALTSDLPTALTTDDINEVCV